MCFNDREWFSRDAGARFPDSFQRHDRSGQLEGRVHLHRQPEVLLAGQAAPDSAQGAER